MNSKKMNSKTQTSKISSSKKSVSSSKKEIKVDPIFIKGFSRCGGCTKVLHNCECYDNISDDAIEQINEFEGKYREEKYRREEIENENEILKDKIKALEEDNEKADDNIQIYKNKIKALEEELEEKSDYEPNFFNLLNKYRLLENDYLELKNKTCDYDYILDENKTLKNERDEEIKKLKDKIKDLLWEAYLKKPL